MYNQRRLIRDFSFSLVPGPLVTRENVSLNLGKRVMRLLSLAKTHSSYSSAMIYIQLILRALWQGQLTMEPATDE